MWLQWFYKTKKPEKKAENFFQVKNLSNGYLKQAFKDLKEGKNKQGRIEGFKPLFYNRKMKALCMNILKREMDGLYAFNIINSLAKIYDDYFSLKGLQRHKIIDSWDLKNNKMDLDKQLKSKFSNHLTKQLEKNINTKTIENNDIFSWAFYDVENIKKQPIWEEKQREYLVNDFKLVKKKVEKQMFNKEESDKQIYFLKFRLIRFMWKWIKIVWMYFSEGLKNQKTVWEIIINKPRKISEKVVLKPSIFMTFSAKARKDLKNVFLLEFNENTHMVKKDLYYLTPNLQNLINNDYIFMAKSVKDRIDNLAKNKNQFYENHLNYMRKLNALYWQMDLDYLNKLDVNNSVQKMKWNRYKEILNKKKDKKLLEYVSGLKASLRIEKMYKRLKKLYNKEARDSRQNLVDLSLEKHPFLSSLEKTKFSFSDLMKKIPFIKKAFALEQQYEDTPESAFTRKLKSLYYIDAEKVKNWYFKEGKAILLQQQQQKAKEIRARLNRGLRNMSEEDRDYIKKKLGLKKEKTYEEKMIDVNNTLRKLKENQVTDSDLEYIGSLLRDQAKGNKQTIEEIIEYIEGDVNYYHRVKKSHLYREYRRQKNKWKQFLKLRGNINDVEHMLTRFTKSHFKGINIEYKQQKQFFQDNSEFNNISSILKTLNIHLPEKVLLPQRLEPLRFRTAAEMQKPEEKEVKPKVKIPLYKRIFRYIFRKSCFTILSMNFIES